jgi:hypothetical protein
MERALNVNIDKNTNGDKNANMKTIESSPIPPEMMAELQEAAEGAANGVRDPEEMRRACERMDRLGEEIRRKHGVLDIGVPAIRELRDE